MALVVASDGYNSWVIFLPPCTCIIFCVSRTVDLLAPKNDTPPLEGACCATEPEEPAPDVMLPKLPAADLVEDAEACKSAKGGGAEVPLSLKPALTAALPLDMLILCDSLYFFEIL